MRVNICQAASQIHNVYIHTLNLNLISQLLAARKKFAKHHNWRKTCFYIHNKAFQPTRSRSRFVHCKEHRNKISIMHTYSNSTWTMYILKKWTKSNQCIIHTALTREHWIGMSGFVPIISVDHWSISVQLDGSRWTETKMARALTMYEGRRRLFRERRLWSSAFAPGRRPCAPQKAPFFPPPAPCPASRPSTRSFRSTTWIDALELTRAGIRTYLFSFDPEKSHRNETGATHSNTSM